MYLPMDFSLSQENDIILFSPTRTDSKQSKGEKRVERTEATPDFRKTTLDFPHIDNQLDRICHTGALVKRQSLATFDLAIITTVQAWEHPLITDIAIGLSFIGSIGPVIVLCLIVIAVLYWVLGHRMEILLLIVVVFGSSILNLLLKWVFQRARPDIHRLIEITGYSYPSGIPWPPSRSTACSLICCGDILTAGRERSINIHLRHYDSQHRIKQGLSRGPLSKRYCWRISGACAWLAFLVRSYEKRMGKRANSKDVKESETA